MLLCQILPLKKAAPLDRVLVLVRLGLNWNIVVFILIPYWVAPYLIAAGYTTSPPIPVMAICVVMHTLGVVIMMVSGIP